MKIYAYIRKSTDDDRLQQLSIKYQKNEILGRFKEYKNIVFIECSESASKRGRNEFNRLIMKIENDIDNNESVVLIAHAIDRLTRNLYDLAKIDELRQRGLVIRTCENDYKGDSAMIMLSIQAIFATDFINKLKSKMRSAYEQGAREGKCFFGTAKGYKVGKIKGIKEPDKIKSLGIIKIFEEFAISEYGTSGFVKKANEIAKLYNLERIENSSLNYILRNKYYIGIIKYKNIEYAGKHKPIIDIKLFNKVQNKLLNKTHIKKTKHNFLYQYKIKCICKNFLQGELQKGNIYYRCRNKECEFKTIREDKIDSIFEKLLNRNKINNSLIKEIKNNIKKHMNTENEEINKIIKKNNEIINTNKKRMIKASNLILDIPDDKDFYLKKYKELRKENERLEEENKNLNNSFLISIKDCILKLCELLNNKFQSYIKENKENKKMILEITGANFYFNNQKRLIINTFNIFELINKPDFTGWLHKVKTKRTTIKKEIEKITELFLRFQNQNSQNHEHEAKDFLNV